MWPGRVTWCVPCSLGVTDHLDTSSDHLRPWHGLPITPLGPPPRLAIVPTPAARPKHEPTFLIVNRLSRLLALSCLEKTCPFCPGLQRTFCPGCTSSFVLGAPLVLSSYLRTCAPRPKNCLTGINRGNQRSCARMPAKNFEEMQFCAALLRGPACT